MAYVRRLNTELTLIAEEREGYWAVYSEELGLTGYGVTQQDAEAHLDRGFRLLTHRLWQRGPEILERELHRLGVTYEMQDVAEDTPRVHTIQRRFSSELPAECDSAPALAGSRG